MTEGNNFSHKANMTNPSNDYEAAMSGFVPKSRQIAIQSLLGFEAVMCRLDFVIPSTTGVEHSYVVWKANIFTQNRLYFERIKKSLEKTHPCRSLSSSFNAIS